MSDGSEAISRRPWITPQLVVLTRSQSEECVLAACKFPGYVGPDVADGACTSGALCVPCVTMGIS
jgi:hypothetical protein